MKVVNLKISVVLLMCASASAVAGQTVDENWDIDANASISIENVAGSIEVSGWDRNEAHLTGELGNSVEDLQISATGAAICCNSYWLNNSRSQFLGWE